MGDRRNIYLYISVALLLLGTKLVIVHSVPHLFYHFVDHEIAVLPTQDLYNMRFSGWHHYNQYNYGAGNIILAVLGIPLFYIIGTSYMSVKILAILISIVLVLLWMHHLRNSYGLYASIIAGILFLTAPLYFTMSTFMLFGYFWEAGIFIVLSLIFLSRFKKKSTHKEAAIFGIINAAALIFTMNLMPMVALNTILASIIYRRRLGHLIYYIICLLPGIILSYMHIRYLSSINRYFWDTSYFGLVRFEPFYWLNNFVFSPKIFELPYNPKILYLMIFIFSILFLIVGSIRDIGSIRSVLKSEERVIETIKKLHLPLLTITYLFVYPYPYHNENLGYSILIPLFIAVAAAAISSIRMRSGHLVAAGIVIVLAFPLAADNIMLIHRDDKGFSKIYWEDNRNAWEALSKLPFSDKKIMTAYLDFGKDRPGILQAARGYLQPPRLTETDPEKRYSDHATFQVDIGNFLKAITVNDTDLKKGAGWVIGIRYNWDPAFVKEVIANQDISQIEYFYNGYGMGVVSVMANVSAYHFTPEELGYIQAGVIEYMLWNNSKVLI